MIFFLDPEAARRGGQAPLLPGRRPQASERHGLASQERVRHPGRPQGRRGQADEGDAQGARERQADRGQDQARRSAGEDEGRLLSKAFSVYVFEV